MILNPHVATYPLSLPKISGMHYSYYCHSPVCAFLSR